MSEIKLTRKWFSETGQIPQGAAANARQAAFYLGMQCEELAEKLHAALPGGGAAAPTIYALDSLGKGRWRSRTVTSNYFPTIILIKFCRITPRGGC